jgi:hypothetical protein
MRGGVVGARHREPNNVRRGDLLFKSYEIATSVLSSLRYDETFLAMTFFGLSFMIKSRHR